VAVSKKRQTVAYKPPRRAGKEKKNPAWFLPVMIGCYLVGVAWIIVAYVSEGKFPLDIGNGNIAVGFGFIIVGFFFTLNWK
jgi:hypothetical protein